MAIGFLFKFYACINQIVKPFISLSIFVLSIRGVLRGQIFNFMSIFMLFILAFVFAMIVLFPDHPSVGTLPQAPDFYHWFTAAYAILMAGMVGEPLDLNMNPYVLAPLGIFQKLNLGVFIALYVIYIFLSLILLLNLLIALLGNTFNSTQNTATLEGRIAFAQVMLRLELLAQFMGIDTASGEPDGSGRHAHLFRDVQKDKESELPRDYVSENVFEKLPTTDPHGPNLLEMKAEVESFKEAQTEGITQAMGDIVRQMGKEIKADLVAHIDKKMYELAALSTKAKITVATAR